MSDHSHSPFATLKNLISPPNPPQSAQRRPMVGKPQPTQPHYPRWSAGALVSVPRFILLSAVLLLLNGIPIVQAAPKAPTLPNPILFTTQIPISPGFGSLTATFGNHLPGMEETGRGGDLWIRYPDGTLKNLTEAAGYGGTGVLTGTQGIAVRDPAVYWDGTKAIFSMVIGAPLRQYDYDTLFRWQMYEVTGFQYPTQTVTITKVPNQPPFNNISPIYGSDDRIIFTTDRPRNGQMHLYPQRDEYELAPTNTGLWSLDPQTGDLFLINHAPSGDFTPILDSFGRVIFTQWDHLQRDQQADGDDGYGTGQNCDGGTPYGTFNYSNETAAATIISRTEVFPEPRSCRDDLLAGTNLDGHSFNQFFPWQIFEDGTDGEIVNHLGRHEFGTYSPPTFNNDPNLKESGQVGGRYNPNPIYNGLFQIKEDPMHPGTFYAIDTPEFGFHASGRIISFTAAPSDNPDFIGLTYVSHPDTINGSFSPNHSGRYREPLPLSNGALVVVHSTWISEEVSNNYSSFDFRLKTLKRDLNGYWVPDQLLTNGISETVEYWQPDRVISYTGNLWELMPVEVRVRPRPVRSAFSYLGAPEQQIFNQLGIVSDTLQSYLRQNNLALIVSHDVTTRDDQDQQQPFNLKVAGSAVQTLGAGGKIYEIAYLQLFQADQLRGWTGCCGTTPYPGRRVLAQPMHEAAAIGANIASDGPAGSVAISKQDGSMAAFVPARRAMTWQLTDANGAGVVRERYWVTFQPGEIRVCASCHGVNDKDQAGDPPPMNPPQALYDLLQVWKIRNDVSSAKLYLPLLVR